jgi:hypothetical protein
MKLPKTIPIYGDTTYRGDCPKESAEQITFINTIRARYPDTWGKIATHVRNEGKKTVQQIKREKMEGMVTGASDIVIGSFWCELKRQDHTKSKISDDQVEFLETQIELGFFGCIALGWQGALEAFEAYLNERT